MIGDGFVRGVRSGVGFFILVSVCVCMCMCVSWDWFGEVRLVS